MQTIKFLKPSQITGLQKIKLNGITYKGYSICELPTAFGMTEDIMDDDGNVVARLSLIDEWFNYKGLTYIVE